MTKSQYNSIELKSCPFCLCDARHHKAQAMSCKLYYFIQCTGYRCGASIRSETKREAIERWNKRADLINEKI